MFLTASCIFCLLVDLSKAFEEAENMLGTVTLSFNADNFNLSEDYRSANDDDYLLRATKHLILPLTLRNL